MGEQTAQRMVSRDHDGYAISASPAGMTISGPYRYHRIEGHDFVGTAYCL